jgi:hypothetical protein
LESGIVADIIKSTCFILVLAVDLGAVALLFVA